MLSSYIQQKHKLIWLLSSMLGTHEPNSLRNTEVPPGSELWEKVQSMQSWNLYTLPPHGGLLFSYPGQSRAAALHHPVQRTGPAWFLSLRWGCSPGAASCLAWRRVLTLTPRCPSRFLYTSEAPIKSIKPAMLWSSFGINVYILAWTHKLNSSPIGHENRHSVCLHVTLRACAMQYSDSHMAGKQWPLLPNQVLFCKTDSEQRYCSS